MTGDLDEQPTEPAWHERTSTLVGASVAALAALAVVYFAISFVAQQFSGPAEVQQYFLDPGASTTRSLSTTTTTATTSYSVAPPQTTDINPGDTTTPSSGTTSSTSRRQRSTVISGDETTTRRAPRFNETRTAFNPGA